MKEATLTASKLLVNKKNVEETFPIVAIGASAGGLDAMTQFLQNLPSNTGMAYIYVQHLSRVHKSILVSLLTKSTKMRVQEVTNKIKMNPDNLYVIPPDKEMQVLDGHIKLIPRKKNDIISLSIDKFFMSLADKHKESVIGIILSGNAKDGTLGLRAIKAEGGLTFAQDDSAKYASMPQSAVTEGVVDYILSPKEIALEIVRLSKQPFIKSMVKTNKVHTIDINDPSLKMVLQYLYAETNIDFTAYKSTTIIRRIQRRMLLYKIKTIREYAKLLKNNSNEIDILYQDLLINVTNFFRDIDTHKYLRNTLLPKILKSKVKGEILRIWIPACSTGEEAYSIAMMLLEVQSSSTVKNPIQIFATDLSPKAIHKARTGLYTKQDVESVSPQRLQRFYTKSENSFRISKAVRDMCIFAQHDLLGDPPFSNLDFISCCNLLIYLDNPAQKKVIGMFHYALNANGYLMLGKSENIISSSLLFTSVNKNFKIFSRKKQTGARSLPKFSPRSIQIPGLKQEIKVKEKKIAPSVSQNFDHSLDQLLIESYLPATIIINHQLEILQFRGNTDLYLSHSSRKPTYNILKLARPEISFDLRYGILEAIKTNKTVYKGSIELRVDNKLRIISIEISPIKIEQEEPLLLIIFKEHDQVEIFTDEIKGTNNLAAKSQKIKKLQTELVAMRADINIVAREQEEIHARLQRANEEIVSSNEELQSVNEELESSKEEIESANEELITTNQELQTRNDMLNESYSFSEAVIATIHEPMLVLDKDMYIKSVNKSFCEFFRVKKEKTNGALFFKVGNYPWESTKLRKMLEGLLYKDNNIVDFEIVMDIPKAGKKIMLLNANRIEQKSHGEQLILLAFNDITAHSLLQIKEKEHLKKAASDAKIHTNLLERAVDQRTAQLKQTTMSLELKNNDLEKVNKEIQSFNYISSHDLQEPLRKIQTFTNFILDRETLTEKGIYHFTRIKDSAHRMQLLIDDILVFSQISTIDRKFEDTDLNLLIIDVKNELEHDIKENNVTIKSDKLCNLNIIPLLFRQLLLNLFTNSIKFAKPNVPLKITIKSNSIKSNKLKSLVPGMNYRHISISDNGIGFEPQYAELIFGVFQKLHDKKEYAGTGIGLAIVKKIIQCHNGIITAKGKLNAGCTFDIYIPVPE